METKKLPLYGLHNQVMADIGHDRERVAAYARMLWRDIAAEQHKLDRALVLEDRVLMLQAAHGLTGLCGYLADTEATQLARQIHQGAGELSVLELSQRIHKLNQLLNQLSARN